MSCSRGCCASPKEHYRSLGFAAFGRADMVKRTVDDHGTHKVEVTEHYQDRQDVTVKVPTVALTTTVKEEF